MVDVAVEDHRAIHVVPDMDALWQGALGSLALTSSLVVFQDPPVQAAIRAAVERRAAAYATPRGLELPIAFRVGKGRKPG